MSAPSCVAADLRAAANLLEEKGWTQGAGARTSNGTPTWSGQDDATCFCAYGAILRATAHDPMRSGYSVAALHNEIDAAITRWNDRVGQTAENVIATLRRVADEVGAA